MVQIPQQVLDDIRQSTKIVAATHVHPDGDALGSLLGFASLMESLGKEVLCLIEEPVPYLYRFLPESDRLHWDLNKFYEFVGKKDDSLIGVSLDCGDKSRLGERLGKELLSLKPFVVIDHHVSHQEFGTSRWVNVESSSTGEMIFELGKVLDARLGYEAAINLYVAIVTDTGSFRYQCTSARTMAIASELLALGVPVDEVNQKLYDNFSYGRLRLLQKVLASLELYQQNQVALIEVTQDMLRKTGTIMDDVETFVNFPRSVNTVKVAILIKEGEAGTVSVSMRAKGDIDVSVIAQGFGGGGHRNAAGFRRYSEDIELVKSSLLEVVGKAVANEIS